MKTFTLTLTAACVRVRYASCYKSPPVVEQGEYIIRWAGKRQGCKGLAIYAARYWVDHSKFGSVSPSIQDLMERLSDPGEPHFATWVWLYDMDRPWKGHMVTARPMRPTAAPLYYATLYGFRNLVEYLSTTYSGDVNARGGSYCTPLHAALAKRA